MISVVEYLILLLKAQTIEEESRAYPSCYGKLQASLFEMKHALSKKRGEERVVATETVWGLAAQIAVDAALTADAYERVFEKVVKAQRKEKNNPSPPSLPLAIRPL